MNRNNVTVRLNKTKLNYQNSRILTKFKNLL